MSKSKSDEFQSKEKEFSRRDFLKTTGAATGGIIGGSLLGGLVGFNMDGTDSETAETDEASESAAHTDSVNRTDALMFFTNEADFAVLAAACELIFPEDDNGPGAIDLGVPYYIDKQMAGAWGMNGTDYRQGPFRQDENMLSADKIYHARQNRGNVFIDALRTINEVSIERFDVTFDEASQDQQGEIMTDLENGDIDIATIDSDGFFADLKQAILEGAYSDPLYGGNKDMEGWRMKEYPGAQMSYGEFLESEEFVQGDMDMVSLIDYQPQSAGSSHH